MNQFKYNFLLMYNKKYMFFLYSLSKKTSKQANCVITVRQCWSYSHLVRAFVCSAVTNTQSNGLTPNSVKITQ